MSIMKSADRVHIVELAWVGDAYLSLAVRRRLVLTTDQKTGALQSAANRYVSAKAQCKLLDRIEPLLTDAERSLVRRGRNAHTAHIAKNATAIEYAAATALEALIGFHVLDGNAARADELIEAMLTHHAAQQ